MTIWTGILYGYNGILLIFSAFLAWETRKVHIAALNDSKLIGMAVYNVFIPCVVIIPVLHILHTQVDAVYTLSALLCIFCTTATLGLIFIPKVRSIFVLSLLLLYPRFNKNGYHSPPPLPPFQRSLIPQTVFDFV